MADPVDALFSRQEGLATVAQLVGLGLPADTVRGRVHRKRWRLVLPRVICRDARPLDPTQRLVAACLLGGPGAVISTWTAVAWHGLDTTSSDRRVHVAVPVNRFVRSSGFVVVRRTSRPDVTAVTKGAVPVASAPRAVADAARDVPVKKATELVLEAVQRRLVTTTALRHELEVGPRQGSLALRVALSEAEQGAWSVPEAKLAELVRDRSGLPPMWVNPSLSADGVTLPTPDGWFDDVGLAVQVHSKKHHAGDLDWEKTVSADGVYAEHGVPLVAITPWQIFNRAEAVLQRIQRAHGQAARRPRPAVRAVPRAAWGSP